MTKLNWQTLGVAALALPLLAVPGLPAAAAEPVEHCAVQIAPVDEPEAYEPVCFKTEAAVQDYLDRLASTDLSRGATASVAIGTVYKDAAGGGSSLTFWGSSGCSGVTFGFASLAAGWDNSISSAGGANGCWLTLYSSTSYGGSRLNCTPWCGSVFGLNDAVKSLVFRPNGTFG